MAHWKVMAGFITFSRYLKLGILLPMSSIPKYRRISLGAPKFLFSKNHRDLKNEYFLKICRTFLFHKKNRPKENFKLNFKMFLVFSQNGQNGF